MSTILREKLRHLQNIYTFDEQSAVNIEAADKRLRSLLPDILAALSAEGQQESEEDYARRIKHEAHAGSKEAWAARGVTLDPRLANSAQESGDREGTAQAELNEIEWLRAEVERLKRPKRAQIAQALRTAFVQKAQWNTRELRAHVQAAGIKATPKEVFNAVGYLKSQGEVKGAGYGAYVAAAPTPSSIRERNHG